MAQDPSQPFVVLPAVFGTRPSSALAAVVGCFLAAPVVSFALPGGFIFLVAIGLSAG